MSVARLTGWPTPSWGIKAANRNVEPVSFGDAGLAVLDSETGLREIFDTLGQLGSDHGVVIKMQTWRGDKVGIEAKEACEEALKRGAWVQLFKDQIGAAFEFGEREGLSLWHQTGDNPKLDLQSRLLSQFYRRNSMAVDPEVSAALNEARATLQGFDGFNLSEGYRYDHSKLVLVYDKHTKQPIKAFIGGACFGDEWGGEVDDQNFDGVVCITDPSILQQVVRSLKGRPTDWQNGVKVLTNTQRQPESYYATIRQNVSGFKGQVEAAIAYMGKADLIQLFEGKEQAKLIVPYEANINRDRNWHFMYEMMRRIEKDFAGGVRNRLHDGRLLSYWWDFMSKANQTLPPELQIVALDQMSHLKAIVCGQVFGAIGSANLVGENAFNEMGLAFKRDSDQGEYGLQQVQFLLRRAENHRREKTDLSGVGINYVKSDLGGNPEVPRFSLLRSQVEHGIMAWQAMLAHWRSGHIARQQQQEQAFFCETFPDA